MATVQETIDNLISYIDAAVAKHSVSNRHVATVLAFFNEWLKSLSSKYLSKTEDDTAGGFITFLKGLLSRGDVTVEGRSVMKGSQEVFGLQTLHEGFETPGFSNVAGRVKGAQLTKNGVLTVAGVIAQSYEIFEFIYNKIRAQGGRATFSDTATIESCVYAMDEAETTTLTPAEFYEQHKGVSNEAWNDAVNSIHHVILVFKKSEGNNDSVPFENGDIIYGYVNRVGESGQYARGGVCSMNIITEDADINRDGSMVVRANLSHIVVDSDNPEFVAANMPPTEGMVVAQNGNVNGKEGRTTSFFIDSESGHIIMLQNVTTPTVTTANYAVISGLLPADLLAKVQKHFSFVKSTTPVSYAMYGIFENFLQLDHDGEPIKTERDRGAWSAEAAVENPYVGSNAKDVTYYDTVTHGGSKWKCLVDRTTEEPSAGSTHWLLIVAKGDDGVSATLYGLIPSTTELVQSENGENAPAQITFDVSKIVGGTATSISDSEKSRLKVLYYVDDLYEGNKQYDTIQINTAGIQRGVDATLYLDGVIVDFVSVLVKRDGKTGPAGADGNDGKDGADGADGADGLSPQPNLIQNSNFDLVLPNEKVVLSPATQESAIFSKSYGEKWVSFTRQRNASHAAVVRLVGGEYKPRYESFTYDDDGVYWCFVGTPADFVIYNKLTGESKALTASNIASNTVLSMVEASGAIHWYMTLVPNSDKTMFVATLADNALGINAFQANSSGGDLALYRVQGDAGSQWKFSSHTPKLAYWDVQNGATLHGSFNGFNVFDGYAGESLGMTTPLLRPDTYYTFSFLYRIEESSSDNLNISLVIEHLLAVENVVTDGTTRHNASNTEVYFGGTVGEWKKAIVTFRHTADTSIELPFSIFNNTSKGIQIAQLKLEEGANATPYRKNEYDFKGEKGDKGDGIKSVTTEYAVTQTFEQPSIDDAGWSTEKPTVVQVGEYLWTKVVTDYTSDSIEDTVVITVSRVGTDGTSITVDSVRYAKSTSATAAPTNESEWKTTPMELQENEYLWTRTTFSDGEKMYTVSKNGESLKVASIKYAQTSDEVTDPSTLTYSDVVPTPEKGKYIWTQTTYSDGKVDYGVAYVPLDGESVIFADLDNEMDSVGLDAEGKADADYTIRTNVSLYNGATKMVLTSLTATLVEGSGLTLKTANKDSGVVEYTVAKGTAVSIRNVISITLVSGDVERVLTLTVNGIRQGADGEPAKIYKIRPNVNQVIKKKDGTFQPANVSCIGSLIVDGEEQPNASGITLRYYKDGSSTATSYTSNTIIASSTFKQMKFELLVNGVVQDVETISVVEDGSDGDDGRTPNENLLLNTNFDVFEEDGKTLKHWTTQDGSIIKEGFEGFNVFSPIYELGTTMPTLEAGKLYTFSLWQKSSATSGINTLIPSVDFSDLIVSSNAHCAYNGGDNKIYFDFTEGVWQRATFTFRPTADRTSISFKLDNNSNKMWYLSRIKLEEGDVATAYQKHPDDLIGEDGKDGTDGADGKDGLSPQENLLLNTNFDKRNEYGGLEAWDTAGGEVLTNPYGDNRNAYKAIGLGAFLKQTSNVFTQGCMYTLSFNVKNESTYAYVGLYGNFHTSFYATSETADIQYVDYGAKAVVPYDATRKQVSITIHVMESSSMTIEFGDELQQGTVIVDSIKLELGDTPTPYRKAESDLLGPAGEAGTAMYPLGDWVKDVLYTRTAKSAPFLYHDADTTDDIEGSYYMLKAMQSIGQKPSEHPDVWEPITGQRALHVKFLMANFALFGSNNGAVFYDRYLFSQRGKDIDGNDAYYGDYIDTMFNADGTLSGVFTPNVLLDFLSGRFIAANATLRGHIDAISGRFAGELVGATGTFINGVISCGDNFRINRDGSGCFAKDRFSWTSVGELYSIYQIEPLWLNISKFYDSGKFILMKGTDAVSGRIYSGISISLVNYGQHYDMNRYDLADGTSQDCVLLIETPSISKGYSDLYRIAPRNEAYFWGDGDSIYYLQAHASNLFEFVGFGTDGASKVLSVGDRVRPRKGIRAKLVFDGERWVGQASEWWFFIL